jgi:hypothetical protein
MSGFVRKRGLVDGNVRGASMSDQRRLVNTRPRVGMMLHRIIPATMYYSS